jgi:hypothetical protein
MAWYLSTELILPLVLQRTVIRRPLPTLKQISAIMKYRMRQKDYNE